MWNKLTCPICDSALRAYGTVENFSKVYRHKALYKCKYGELSLVKGAYQIETHFKMEHRDYKPWYETLFFYPYIIESYDDVSNIYIYKTDRQAKRFIVETPYLDLPWKDKDAVIRKLKLYTVFS